MCFALCFDWDTAVWQMDTMGNPFAARESTRTWLQDEYMPEFKVLVQGKRIPWYSAIDVMIRFSGAITKIFWAFLWQEQAFVYPDDPDNWIYSSDG